MFSGLATLIKYLFPSSTYFYIQFQMNFNETILG